MTRLVLSSLRAIALVGAAAMAASALVAARNRRHQARQGRSENGKEG